MSEENNLQPIDEKWSFEAEHNAVGFFDLLLRIDQRINPDNYKQTNDSEKQC